MIECQDEAVRDPLPLGSNRDRRKQARNDMSVPVRQHGKSALLSLNAKFAFNRTDNRHGRKPSP